MPPPTNTTAATALLITELPYSTTQTVHDAGVTYDVWYTYTPADCIELLGIVAHGGASPYTPRAEVYVGPASAPVVWHNNSGNNDASQVPVVPGTEYFLRFRTNTGNPTPALLSLSITAGPNGTAPAGSLVIADDTPGYPAIVVDATTGTVLRSVYPFPAGEEGDSLPGGTVLMADPYDTDTFRLYSPTFALIASIPFLGINYARVRATPAAGLYYIADGGFGATPPTVGTVTPTGTLGATTWTLPAGGEMGALAGNNTGTILYYTHPYSDATLRRWDLVNDVGLGTLAAAITDHVVPDILMLVDGSLVVGYYKGVGSPKNYTVKRYNASGTVLNTYEFGSNFSMPPRLGYSLTAGAFWVYSQPQTGTYDGNARIFEVRASDGVMLTTLTVPQYVAGSYELPITGATPVSFGVSPSCPIFPLWSPLPACGEEPVDEGGPGPIAWIEWRQRIGVTTSDAMGAPRIDTWVTHIYSDHDLQCPPSYYHGFKEARVEHFGEASRTLSDARTGDWQGARCELRLSDYDRVLRTRLASETERYWTTGLVTMRIVSREIRAQLRKPLTVFVGPIRRATPAPPLSIDLQLEDHAGHAMLNDELLIPQRLVDPLRFPTIALADSAKGHPEPIIYGVHAREAGAFAPIYLGKEDQQHVWLIAGHYAAVTDIFLDGVSVLGTDGVDWSVPGGAAPAYEEHDGRRYTLLRGKAGQSAAATTPILYADNAGAVGAYFETWSSFFGALGAAGRFNVNATSGVHGGSRCIHGVDLRGGDVALGKFGATGPPGTAVDRGYAIAAYDELVLWIRNETVGWLDAMLHLRFARFSDPVEPVGTTVTVVDGTYGLDTFSTDWQELHIPIGDFGDLTDLRCEHLIIAKSGTDAISLALDDITLQGGDVPEGEITPADTAVSGDARLTVNVKGWTTSGDTGGTVITDIFQQYQHFLINYVAHPAGYLTGVPLPNPQHDLFDKVVNTVKEESFAEASALAVTRFPPDGYIGRGILGATPSDRLIVRDWIARWNLSADCRFGVTRFGELMVVLSSPTAADRDAAPLYDSTLDLLAGSFEVDVQWDQQGTKIPYRADYNWATQEWTAVGDVSDPAASENYGRASSGVPHPVGAYWFIPTEAQAINVAEHELRRVTDPPKVLTFDVPIVHPAGTPLVQRELGSYIRVTHFAGIGPGEIRLCQIEMVSVWPGTRRLRVRAVDVEDLIVA